jgi:hypothetical protein
VWRLGGLNGQLPDRQRSGNMRREREAPTCARKADYVDEDPSNVRGIRAVQEGIQCVHKKRGK